MPPWLIPAILTAFGTAVTMRNNSAAQKRQRDAIVQAQQRQTKLTDEAGKRTVDFAGETYDPETRAVNEAEAAKGAEESLMQQINASRDRGIGKTSDATGGKISDDYSTDRAKMVAQTLQRASTLANLMGKTRGATDLRFQEGIKGARHGGDMADLASLGRSRASTDAGLIPLAGQVDPRRAALGSLLTSVGTSQLAGQANLGNIGGGSATSGTWAGTTPTLKPGQFNSLTPTRAVGWF